MGTIADKLAYLGQTKAEIRDAIISKGITVPAATAFREYAGKIREITSEEGNTNPAEWTRPADWLPIAHKVVAGDQKFVGLHAIYEDSNFVSLTATGNYTVDWGDGLVENFTSGAQAYHLYSYDAFPGTETAGGNRQAIVTVTPQAGQNLTGINLQKKHNQAGLNNLYNSGWLDIRISGQNIASLIIGGQTIYHRCLESFCFVGNNAITDFNRFFSGCYVLQSIPMLDTSNGTDFKYMFQVCTLLQSVPLLDTSKGINFSSMFQSCIALQTLPLFNTAKGTVFGNMFQDCISLKTVPFFDTAKGTDFRYMFQNCKSLRTVPLFDTSMGINFSSMFQSCTALQEIPLLNTVKGTNFNNMFSSNTSLQTVPLLNTANGTDFSGMFSMCYNLQTVPLLDTAKGTNFSSMFTSNASLQAIPLLDTANGTNFGSMFSGCTLLQTIPLLDTSKGTEFSVLFSGCYALETLPLLNTSNVARFDSMFTNCGTLSKASFSGTKENISYTGCKLSRTALVAVFSNLASGVVAKTITITNNWGAALLTAEDRAVATDKGWTIVG